MRRTLDFGLALLVIALAGAPLPASWRNGGCGPVGPTVQPPKKGYQWIPEAGFERYVLKFGDQKVGLYEVKTEIFREYEDGGKSLGKPKPFPWKSRETKEERKPAATEAVPSEPPPEPMAPWMPYAVGGGVAGLLVLMALAAQFRGG